MVPPQGSGRILQNGYEFSTEIWTMLRKRHQKHFGTLNDWLAFSLLFAVIFANFFLYSIN